MELPHHPDWIYDPETSSHWESYSFDTGCGSFARIFKRYETWVADCRHCREWNVTELQVVLLLSYSAEEYMEYCRNRKRSVTS